MWYQVPENIMMSDAVRSIEKPSLCFSIAYKIYYNQYKGLSINHRKFNLSGLWPSPLFAKRISKNRETLIALRHGSCFLVPIIQSEGMIQIIEAAILLISYITIVQGLPQSCWADLLLFLYSVQPYDFIILITGACVPVLVQ